MRAAGLQEATGRSWSGKVQMGKAERLLCLICRQQPNRTAPAPSDWR